MKTGGKAVKPEKPLLLNGKPLTLKPSTPQADKLIAFLQALPDGEVFDRHFILGKGIISSDRLRELSQRDPRMKELCTLAPGGDGHNARYLFGNPNAIKALKKLIEAQS
jgi:hypothetical protein